MLANRGSFSPWTTTKARKNLPDRRRPYLLWPRGPWGSFLPWSILPSVAKRKRFTTCRNGGLRSQLFGTKVDDLLVTACRNGGPSIATLRQEGWWSPGALPATAGRRL